MVAEKFIPSQSERSDYFNPQTGNLFSDSINNILNEGERLVEGEDTRNFDINIQANEKAETIITLIKTNGDYLPLNSFLPSGYILKPAESYYCDTEKKEIGFNPKSINYKGGLISLGHEIGHSLLTEPLYEQNIFQRAIGLYKGFRRFKKVSKQAKDSKDIEKLLFVNNQDIAVFLPDKTKDSRYIQSARSERDASAICLRLLRTIQKMGFQVFADFSSVEEIREFIDHWLTRYELVREGDKSMFYEKDSPKYKPIYVHKYKPVKHKE